MLVHERRNIPILKKGCKRRGVVMKEDHKNGGKEILSKSYSGNEALSGNREDNNAHKVGHGLEAVVLATIGAFEGEFDKSVGYEPGWSLRYLGKAVSTIDLSEKGEISSDDDKDGYGEFLTRIQRMVRRENIFFKRII
ncbi:hypothetical protein CUMW_255800 [Citrus unshiu]|uniref:Uncharacterized protein n=1 Tax=Citrus unshiu TaxID=55188 RepID=A0A2H5QRV7_CITUN|nr:hypothetical protein CUMW_255800 [Citrus unshiu]